MLGIDTEVAAPVTMSGQNMIRLVDRRTRAGRVKPKLKGEANEEQSAENREQRITLYRKTAESVFCFLLHFAGILFYTGISDRSDIFQRFAFDTADLFTKEIIDAVGARSVFEREPVGPEGSVAIARFQILITELEA